mmetsp:Transcript_35242/g.60940  ORF Transcript_35242/g.60940 Transcript_35242/m.60940 type:complete len:250 (-) Transcript_35242:1018-1767(-)
MPQGNWTTWKSPTSTANGPISTPSNSSGGGGSSGLFFLVFVSMAFLMVRRYWLVICAALWESKGLNSYFGSVGELSRQARTRFLFPSEVLMSRPSSGRNQAVILFSSGTGRPCCPSSKLARWRASRAPSLAAARCPAWWLIPAPPSSLWAARGSATPSSRRTWLRAPSSWTFSSVCRLVRSFLVSLFSASSRGAPTSCGPESPRGSSTACWGSLSSFFFGRPTPCSSSAALFRIRIGWSPFLSSLSFRP